MVSPVGLGLSGSDSRPWLSHQLSGGALLKRPAQGQLRLARHCQGGQEVLAPGCQQTLVHQISGVTRAGTFLSPKLTTLSLAALQPCPRAP